MNDLTPQEEQHLISKGQLKGAWLNPATTWERGDNGQLVRPLTIYVDAGKEPSWDMNNAAFDVAIYQHNLSAYKSGKTNDYQKFTRDPWLGDWKKLNDRRVEQIKSGNLKSGGFGTNADYTAIDVVNVAALVNTELRDFTLEMAVTTVSTPQLKLSVDTYTRFTGQKAIAEGTEPTTKLGSISRTTYTIGKDGTAIGLTFEAQAMAAHDLYRTHVDNAISDLRRIKSNKIATELETATDVSGADWAAYSTDHSTTSPYDNIGTVCDTIVSNNGRPNVIASHDKVYRDFLGNTHVKGTGDNAAHEGMMSTARVITGITGLEGFTWYIDNEKTATIATVYDKGAVFKMQGPVRTATVRNELADVDYYRIFDFNLPEIIIAGRIRDLTGVTA